MKIQYNFSRFNALSKLNINKLVNDIAEEIATEGEDIARSKYTENVNVSHITASNGRSQIITEGDKVAYLEFGTGIEGQQNDYDNLGENAKKPTQTLNFTSYGQKQSTQGWQYNYRKEQGQTDKDWKGFKPQAQMFYTAKELKEKLPQIVDKIIKGE